MKTVVRRTWTLVAILAVLVLIDFGVRRGQAEALIELPALPRLDEEAIERIVLTKGDVRVELAPGDQGWRMEAPIEAPADRGAVKALYGTLLHDGVPMDTRVDEGHLEDYGLEQGAVRVDIQGEAGPLTSFYVGADAGGGATYVRFPDSEEVFLARIGGRHRFDRSPGQWRDHMVVRILPDVLSRIELRPADGPALVLEREDDGPWVSDTIDVDQELAKALAQQLGGLRAGAVLGEDFPAGLETPAAYLVLASSLGDEVELALGRNESGTFARRSDGPLVYRVGPGVLDLVRQPPATWADRQLVDIARADIRRMTLVEKLGGRSVLEIDPATSRWTITRPANVAADQRIAMFAARTLGQLRAERMSAAAPEDVGFPSGDLFELERMDGAKVRIEVGTLVPKRGNTPALFHVRTSDQPSRVGLVRADVLVALRKAWAR